MHWEILIIPLIAVGVWLLGTIFRGVEEERQKARPRRPGEGGGLTRRPVTDLDRFLEEARRRREAAEDRPNPPSQDWAQVVEVLPAPRPEVFPPAPRPRKPRPARAERPFPPVKDKVSRRQAEPAAPITVTRQPAPAPEPAFPTRIGTGPAATPRPEVAQEEAIPVAPLPPPARSPSAGQPPSPVLAQVTALLRGPQSAGAALVLSEILGPPLCRRKR